MRKCMYVLIFLSVIITGCSIFQPADSELVPEATAIPTFAPVTTPDSILVPTAPLNITIWLPEEFNPEDDSEASQLLKNRLNEFTERHPGVRVEVRIKALEGTGGLLDALSTAHTAAPLALPDLIILPMYEFTTAVARDLLYPIDALSLDDDRSDIYDFANQMTNIQGTHFGVPFAIDSLILAYQPSNVGDPPRDWASVLDSENILGFAAADRQAFTSLALYHSAGGQFLDDEDRPTLENATLLELLSFLDSARQSGVTPYWLTQYDTDDRAWQAFILNQTNLVVTWMHHFMTSDQDDIAATHIPTLTGSPYTIANGWILAIATPQSERHELAYQLASFLTESQFIGEWTSAAGYFPPRSNALESWSTPTNQALANQLLPIAQVVPAESVINFIGPILKQITVDVLKNQLTPDEAVQVAVELLSSP